jgi:hypothetical protein
MRRFESIEKIYVQDLNQPGTISDALWDVTSSPEYNPGK